MFIRKGPGGFSRLNRNHVLSFRRGRKRPDRQNLNRNHLSKRAGRLQPPEP